MAVIEDIHGSSQWMLLA